MFRQMGASDNNPIIIKFYLLQVSFYLSNKSLLCRHSRNSKRHCDGGNSNKTFRDNRNSKTYTDFESFNSVVLVSNPDNYNECTKYESNDDKTDSQ